MTELLPPRLLVALKPSTAVEEELARQLPSVPWAYVNVEGEHRWQDVEAILVGSVDRELGSFQASATPRLRFFQVIYTGVDRFPFDRFPAPIEIAANIGAYAPFVAEHAVTLALAAARTIVPVQGQMHEHRLRPPPDIRLLRGRTAVILGFGHIGREISRRLAGFDVRIIAVNRSGRMAPDTDRVYPADHMVEALAEGDLVFDARPLTRATLRSIGERELNAMPLHAIFVNVGRAATVDEEALYRHLTAHPEFRAAFDPWWDEDFAAGVFRSRFPLLDLPNFLGTPHCAGFGPATERYALERAVENVARFFREGRGQYLVDRSEYTD